MCTDVSTDGTGLHGSTCPYISTKVTGAHVVTSTEKYKLKTCVHGSTNMYDEYGRYKPIRDIGMEVVGKVRKGISYADDLHKGS